MDRIHHRILPYRHRRGTCAMNHVLRVLRRIRCRGQRFADRRNVVRYRDRYHWRRRVRFRFFVQLVLFGRRFFVQQFVFQLVLFGRRRRRRRRIPGRRDAEGFLSERRLYLELLRWKMRHQARDLDSFFVHRFDFDVFFLERIPVLHRFDFRPERSFRNQTDPADEPRNRH